MGTNSPQPCADCGQRIALSDSTLCSICETPPLPGMAPSGTVGQKDDWFETPYPLAQVCVAQVVAVIEAANNAPMTWGDNPIRKVLCPAVGRGVFARAVRAYYDELDAPPPNIVGCDVVDRQYIPTSCMHGDCGVVAPLATCRQCKGSGRVDYESDDYPPGTNGCCCTCARCRGSRGSLDAFVQADARTWVPGPGPWDLAIDNIPFEAEVAIPIVQRFTEVCAWSAFILPWSPLGGVEQWAPIMASGACRPLWAWPIAPRPWGEHTRETALYLWRRGEQPAYTRVAELPRWKP